MAVTALRILQSVHGHLGALAIAALLHPAILLARGKRPTRGGRYAITLATAFTVATFALGVSLYGPYRAIVKRSLFAAHPGAGWLFETKEHLAFATICFAIGGLGTALFAPRDASSLYRLASAMFAAAALTGVVVGGLGVHVASLRSF